MTFRRKLGFESLETRRVCAGNVTVKIVNDELQISGVNTNTAAANNNYVDIQEANVGGQVKFVVTGKAFAGNFTASGEPIIGGAVTKINGKEAAFRGAASKISIKMNAGNDAVVLGGKNLQVNVSGLQITAGTGSDYVRLSNVKLTSTTTSNLDMTGSGGFSNAAQAEAGADKLVVNDLVLAGGSLAAATGGGADRVVASNINVTNSHSYVYVYAGNGADTLSVTGSKFFKVSAYMGTSAEKDTVTVQGTTSNEVTVDMGAGNNDLLNLVSNVTVKTRTTLNGGAGSGDTLKVGSNVHAAGRDITGFEVKPFGL